MRLVPGSVGIRRCFGPRHSFRDQYRGFATPPFFWFVFRRIPWVKPYLIYLIRRNSEEATELAEFELPTRFEKDVCELKGVYALDDDVKAWLKEELGI